MNRFGTFAVILATSVALAATPALALRKRATVTGVVSSGTDDVGIFGMAGSDLTGAAYKISFVYDPSLVLNLESGGLPILLAEATINGFTYKMPNTNVTLSDFSRSQSPPNFSMRKATSFFGDFSGADDNISVIVDLPVALDSIGTNATPAVSGGSDLISLERSDNVLGYAATQAFGTPQTLAITGNVPEPANWAMMIAGFGLIGATQRRRRLSARSVAA
jgi:hypothetical protein